KEEFAPGLQIGRAAAAAEPAKPEWTALIAEFLYRSGDKKKAEETLGKLAASQDVDDVLAAADVYARVKDFVGSGRVARHASVRFPESTEALFRLGAALESTGSAVGAAES